MAEHSVSETEARDRLPDLIDRALAGEDVRITRDGAPVVELRGVAPRPSKAIGRALTHADLDWLRANRVGDRARLKEDAGEAVRRMRDEDWV